jgi:hypothetical protein
MNKKHKRLLELYRNEIPQMYEDYWKQINYWEPAVIEGKFVEKHTEKTKYLFRVKEIATKFKISEYELRYLINHHPEHIKKCRYCAEGIEVNSRTGKYMSCLHYRKCRKKDCAEGARNDLCDFHRKEESEDWEEKWINEKKKQEAYSSQLFCEDTLPDMSYILCLEVIDGFIQIALSKIKLTDISIRWERDKETCYFKAFNKIYYCWLSLTQLTNYIDFYSQQVA